ncbi:MAG: glycosyltransferase family 4 protein [Tepidisphaeraceae bacterium]
MTRKRRLLSIAHSYVVAMNRRLAHEMARAGGDHWEVVAVAPDYFHGSGDLRPVAFEALASEPCRVEVVPAHLTRFVHVFRYGRRLKEILRADWDIVHAWQEPYVVAAWQIARWTRRGVPLVYRTAQSLIKRYPPPFGSIERHNMTRSAGWICSGTLVEQTLKQKNLYRNRPMARIPLGVDVEVFKPDRAAGSDVLRKLGWNETGGCVVGYLGRFVPAKGLDLLMSALDECPLSWRMLFIGAGPEEPAIHKWSQRWPQRVRVCTDVRHADVPRYLNAMDLMCAPSQTTPNWREQFGRMIIEAFATGVAVIGSDSGEIPHVIGDSGIVCPERDRVAWTAALTELLGDPARRAALGARGLQKAREQFAWQVVGRSYLDFFERILAGGREPS